MKPDWLNDSSVTQVEVVSEGSYIRHIMVLPLTGARASSKNKPWHDRSKRRKRTKVASDNLSPIKR